MRRLAASVMTARIEAPFPRRYLDRRLEIPGHNELPPSWVHGSTTSQPRHSDSASAKQRSTPGPDPLRGRPKPKVLTISQVLDDSFAVESDHVILCAGAFETAHLLLRSGIGPAPDLHRVGIPVVSDIPGVGAGFSDHPQVVLH